MGVTVRSELEQEKQRRICVAVWAYAYEVENDPLVPDAKYDEACRAVNPALKTGNATLDKFFATEFSPDTGLWVHKHPEIHKLKHCAAQLREARKAMLEETLNPAQRKALAAQIAADLDAHTAAIYDDGKRAHLGASVIGQDCRRKTWYDFRWCYTESFADARGKDQKGRMMRLFNRGHKEEFRFVEWLRGMGFEVDEFDPTSKLFYHPESDCYIVANEHPGDPMVAEVTGEPQHEQKAAGQGIKRKQARISGVNGHFGGSTDGAAKLPLKYGDLPVMLLEFKTSGTKYFDKLKQNGVKVEKPVHYTQMCLYGRHYGYKYALYMCVNKDTDEVYIEIVELDFNHAEANLATAEAIINSPVPPPKINENSASFSCKFCRAHGICHGSAPYEKNCRSCKNAVAVENAQWQCNLYQQLIPADFIKQGCDSWTEAR